MKKYKLITTLTSLAVIIAIAMSGCSKAPKDPGKDVPAVTEGDTSKIITINWMAQNDKPVDPESPVTKELEKMFNIKLNYIYMDRSKETELLNVRLASGDIPDVMRTGDDARYRVLIDQGVLAELPEDMIKKYSPTLYSETKKVFYDSVFDQAKQDGKLYGIPYANLNGTYYQLSVWRDDWLKNVGIDKIPVTTAEAEAAFYKFRNDDPDKNGKKDTYAMSNMGITSYLYAFGGPGLNLVEDKDGKLIPNVLNPDFKQAMINLSKLYKDQVIDPEFTTGENKGQYWASSILFHNGKIGFTQPGTFYHVNPPLNDKDLGSVNYQGLKSLNPNATYAMGKTLLGPSGKGFAPKWGTSQMVR